MKLQNYTITVQSPSMINISNACVYIYILYVYRYLYIIYTHIYKSILIYTYIHRYINIYKSVCNTISAVNCP